MSHPTDRRIFVFGATGTMGQRIVSLLLEFLAADRVVAVARRGGDLQVDIADPAELPLSAGDVVVDAVGPFLHDPRPIVRHCLQHDAHYLDLSESADFHRLLATALDAHEEHQPAVSALVPGCSTIPAMVDVLMPAKPGCTRTVLLSVGIKNDASPPLLFGLLRPLGRTHRDGRWWHATTVRVLLDGRRRRYGSHPSPFADGDTQFYCGLDRQPAYWLLKGLSALTRHLSDAQLLTFCRLVAPVAPLAARLGTARGSLRLEQRSGQQLETLIEIRAENDGLIIPALPAVWAAQALVERDDVVGLTALSALISPAEIFADLQERGYAVVQPSLQS